MYFVGDGKILRRIHYYASGSGGLDVDAETMPACFVLYSTTCSTRSHQDRKMRFVSTWNDVIKTTQPGRSAVMHTSSVGGTLVDFLFKTNRGLIFMILPLGVLLNKERGKAGLVNCLVSPKLV